MTFKNFMKILNKVVLDNKLNKTILWCDTVQQPTLYDGKHSVEGTCIFESIRYDYVKTDLVEFHSKDLVKLILE